MSSPTSQGKMGKTCLPQKVGEDGEDMSSPTLRQRQGRHDLPDISRKIGKTCLPQHLKEDREDMSSPTSQAKTGKT